MSWLFGILAGGGLLFAIHRIYKKFSKKKEVKPRFKRFGSLTYCILPKEKYAIDNTPTEKQWEYIERVWEKTLKLYPNAKKRQPTIHLVPGRDGDSSDPVVYVHRSKKMFYKWYSLAEEGQAKEQPGNGWTLYLSYPRFDIVDVWCYLRTDALHVAVHEFGNHIAVTYKGGFFPAPHDFKPAIEAEKQIRKEVEG